MPSSIATAAEELMRPSAMTQVAGGERVERRWRKKAGQCWRMEVQRVGMSCVALASTGFGGRPSGMEVRWKPSIALFAAAAADEEERRRRRWLNSVFTMVMRKPPTMWRILARVRIGLRWPCAGKDIKTAWGVLTGSDDEETIGLNLTTDPALWPLFLSSLCAVCA
ncbi:hypothetical protein IEQ34_019435 [Dendrobium chrysotoxum]|uniref:Uncharacterized protein n=1 Tax=Dendrobium chrysotoxum TaxID=161865 RepID=A0AAV7G7D2_DENCH|nr:hypothetical protein IEQ34_019435 [Dendrobium chrysotoxum]